MTSGSKITAYVERYSTDGPQYETQLADAGARVVKIENDFERVKILLALYPNLKVVYRDINRLENPFNGRYGVGDPVGVANEWMGRATPLIDEIPTPQRGRLYFSTPFNEPGDLENATKLAWYGAEEKRRMELIELTGIHAACFGFSAEGNLKDKWLPLRPAIAYALTHGHVYDTHGYNSRSMFDPGVSGHDVEDFLFNHQGLAAEIEAAGYTIPNGFFFYGEFGIDLIFSPGGPSNPAKPYSGWLTTGFTAEEYTAQLAQADSVLMADRRVLGAAVYIWHNSPGMHTDYNIRFARQPRRGQFETPTVAERLLTYIASVPAQPDPPQPQPPNPQPGAGQYEITQPLNIRAGRGKATADIGDLARGSLITVSAVSGPDADGNTWAELRGYVAINLAKKV